MTVANTANQRRHPRHEISVDVVVVFPDMDPVTLKTGNVSEGGIFLLDNGTIEFPPVGTVFVATLTEFLETSEPMALRAQIVHRSEEGIGVEFLGPI